MYKLIYHVNNQVERYYERKDRSMIKGVTKSIIEINPKNSYFEKIIIILSNCCDGLDQEEIKKEAQLLTSKAPEFLIRQRRRNNFKLLLSGTAGALISAAAIWVIYSFV